MAGKLHVGFQIGSPIIAKRTENGDMTGVAVDIGKFIAEKLGVELVLVVYPNQEAYARSFEKGEWDIVIGANSALAREKSEVGPDFMVADAKYIAGPSHSFGGISQVDQIGIKVGVSRGGGSDQFLTQALKHAQVVPITGGVTNAVEALHTGKVDVWAANPITLQEIEMALPGSKVIPGAWTTGRYAVSLPKGRSPTVQSELWKIVTEAKQSGVVQRAIERAGFQGVYVAP